MSITARSAANRWVQIWLGVLCMVLIANLQYGWTLFVNPMHQAHGFKVHPATVSRLLAQSTVARPGSRRDGKPHMRSEGHQN